MSMPLPLTLVRAGARKYRVQEWFVYNTSKTLYGVQCNVTYGAWANVVVDGQIYLTTSRDEARGKAKEWAAL